MDFPSTTPRIADGAVSAAHCAPVIVAARLRRGVELPSGRIAGETDRVVHLIPVGATTTVPDHLTAFCGLAIWPDQAEYIAVGTGMPCMPCVIAAPRPEDTVIADAVDTQ